MSGSVSRSEGPLAGLALRLGFGFGAQAAGLMIQVALAPLILELMGAPAFGLVTFATVLQAWMLLFDLGVSAVLARQLSRHRAGALEAGEARSLLAASETLFLVGGGVALAVFFLARHWIAERWLGASAMAPRTIELSLTLIAFLLVLRWMSGLYQAALAGLERQTAVYTLVLAGSLARAAASIGVLVLVSSSPVAYFAVNVGLILVEVVLCRVLLARAIAAAPASLAAGWRLLGAEFPFAVGLIVSSLAATLINQADRLALSHALPLGEYGLFGLVASVSAGIAAIAPPFVQAFQPRLTGLLAQDRRADFAQVYRLCVATAFTLAIGFAGAIAARPDWVLFAWTGDAALARHLAPILAWYAVGAGIAAYLFVPFMLQYAQGTVRLHVIGNLVFAAIWVPAAVWAALTYGPLGSGKVWLVGKLLYLLLWVPLVHRRLLGPDERRGLDAGVWLRGAGLAALLAGAHFAPLREVGRVEALALLAALSLAVTTLAALSWPELRRFVGQLAGGRWR